MSGLYKSNHSNKFNSERTSRLNQSKEHTRGFSEEIKLDTTTRIISGEATLFPLPHQIFYSPLRSLKEYRGKASSPRLREKCEEVAKGRRDELLSHTPNDIVFR